MGRRKKAKAIEAAAASAAAGGPPLDRGQLADCLSQTSKIAAECNSILRDLLRGRSPQHQDLQRLASQVLMGQSLGLTDLQRKMESQQATLAELLKMLKPAAAAAALGPPLASDGDATAMLASYAAQQPSLSVVKGWDALNLLAAPVRRRKGQKVDRRGESSGSVGGSKRERCYGVEAYWRQLEPAQRRRLMRVPLSKMAEAVRAEQGAEGVRELAEALALLRQQGGRYAAYWRCPCCDSRLLDAASFVRHMQLYHEEVQYSPSGAAVQCTKCLKEVVGAHYQNEEPGFPTVVLCMNCCWEEQILQSAGGDDSGSAMQLRMPQPGQPLLPLAATAAAEGDGSGGGGGRWSWLGPSGLRHSLNGEVSAGRRSRSGSGSVTESSTDPTSDGSSGHADEGSSSEEEHGGNKGASGGGAWGQRRRAARRRRGGGDEASYRELMQQMRLQMESTGGLLAAVARRLDALSTAPTAGSDEAAAAEAAGGANRGVARVPFEQMLLALVAQSQALLSAPMGAKDGQQPPLAAVDEKKRLELEVKLAAPEAFPNQEEHLQASLPFLTAKELQCLLGYAITKHGRRLGPGSGAAGGELLNSSTAAAAVLPSRDHDTGGSPERRHLAGVTSSSSSSSSSDEEDGEGGEDGGLNGIADPGSPMSPVTAQRERLRQERRQRRRRQRSELAAESELMLSYEPGCACVFGFMPGGGNDGSGGSGGGKQLQLEGGSLNGGEHPSSGGGGGSISDGSGGSQLLQHQLAELQRQAGSLVADLPEGRGLRGDEWLEPHSWWIEHLAHKSWHDFANDGAAEMYLLQWIYGNVAHAPTEEFQDRQRLAAGSKGCDNALMECLAEVAEVWRQLAAAMGRKRHLQSLREGVREESAAVRAFEEARAAALRTQAAEFFDEVGGSSSPRSAAAAPSSGGTSSSTGGVQWSQRALGKLQRFHQLKDESSIRYAQALIDREVAVLELAEEMDRQELQLAAAEVASIEAALGEARRTTAEAEAERQRVVAEGPAVHRRNDLLDKVNKEAEHRERLQELQQRITAGQERISSEEGFLADARKRHDELGADLEEVRCELSAFLERRSQLDSTCQEVLSAQERDRDQQLTEAHVDQRIRAVWQVVTCVADAIRLLHDRYAPDAQSKEAERHIRCTGLAQGVCDELEERATSWCADLDRLRRRAVDLACSDASSVVEQAALEVIRIQLEEAAVAAREAATLDLLRELDLEEAAKKAAEGKKGKKKKKKGGRAAEEEEEAEEEQTSSAPGAEGAAAAKKAGTAEVAKPGRRDSKQGSGESGSSSANEGDSAAGPDAGAAGKQMASNLDHLAPELRAELEYEAALERRRRELEAERQRKEAEMLRLAEEASLRELQQQQDWQQLHQQQHAAAAGAGGAAGGKAAGKGTSAIAATLTASGGAAAAGGVGGKAKGGSGSDAAAQGSGSKSPKAAGASSSGSKSAPGTPGKVKAAGAAAAASSGGRVITVAVAAVRGGSGRTPASPPPPPPPGNKSPATKPAAAPAAPPPPSPAAKPTEAAATTATPNTSSAQQAQHKYEMRVVSYYGDWRCFCGETNRLWDTCVCGQIPPCRDWVRGRCTYKTRCRFAHPPFELPDTLPRPKSPIAKPSADATVITSTAGGPSARTSANGSSSGGKGGFPEGPVVVTATRVVPVGGVGGGGGGSGAPKTSGGTAQRAVQLVKPGGRPGGTAPAGAASAAGRSGSGAAATPADAAPPPPLKPAPWANVKPGAGAGGQLPSDTAAAGAGDSQASFSLFGGSSRLLLSALGPPGGSVGASEPALHSLGPELMPPGPAAGFDAPAPAPALPLSAFATANSGSLFGSELFSPLGPTPAAAGLGAEQMSEPQHSLTPPQQPSQPLSPTHLASGGSLPQSPLLLSPPQQSRLAATTAGPSPAGLLASVPFLHSPQHLSTSLSGPLGDLPLRSTSAMAQPIATTALGAGAGLDLPGYAAFHHHPHGALPAVAAAFGSNGGSSSGGGGGLDFGLGGSFLGPAAGGFGGTGLGMDGHGGSGGRAGGSPGGTGLDDWSDLQQQLPSDLGAMLGTDPSLQHQSPVKTHLQAQPTAEAAGGNLYSGGGNTHHHWF